MPRQPRYRIAGYPQHVVQRGNDRQAAFFADGDFRLYRHYLAEAADEHDCDVHAYCLMTNHVHLLVTPQTPGAIPKLMQALGRRYVYHINRTYARSGTLWEGRYRATLVDHDGYVLACHRYIELNPVRAAVVGDAAHYPYSSHRGNALGETDIVVRAHPAYTALGSTPTARLIAYRRMFAQPLATAQLDEIRQATKSCLVLGSAQFRSRIEQLLNRPVPSGKVGRPNRSGRKRGQTEFL